MTEAKNVPIGSPSSLTRKPSPSRRSLFSPRSMMGRPPRAPQPSHHADKDNQEGDEYFGSNSGIQLSRIRRSWSLKKAASYSDAGTPPRDDTCMGGSHTLDDNKSSKSSRSSPARGRSFLKSFGLNGKSKGGTRKRSNEEEELGVKVVQGTCLSVSDQASLQGDEGSAFEVSLSAQNYGGEELITDKSSDNVIGPPPRVNRTEINWIAMPMPLEEVSNDSSRASTPTAAKSEQKSAKSVASHQMSMSNGAFDQRSVTSVKSQEPSVHSEHASAKSEHRSVSSNLSAASPWKISVAVDPTPKPPRDALSIASKSESLPGILHPLDENDDTLSEESRPIMWIHLTTLDARDMIRSPAPAINDPSTQLPRGDNTSRSSSFWQYSEETSLDGSKISLGSPRSEANWENERTANENSVELLASEFLGSNKILVDASSDDQMADEVPANAFEKDSSVCREGESSNSSTSCRNVDIETISAKNLLCEPSVGTRDCHHSKSPYTSPESFTRITSDSLARDLHSVENDHPSVREEARPLEANDTESNKFVSGLVFADAHSASWGTDRKSVEKGLQQDKNPGSVEVHSNALSEHTPESQESSVMEYASSVENQSNVSSERSTESPKSVMESSDLGNTASATQSSKASGLFQRESKSRTEKQEKSTSSKHSRSSRLSKSCTSIQKSAGTNFDRDSAPIAHPIQTIVSDLSWDSIPEENWSLQGRSGHSLNSAPAAISTHDETIGGISSTSGMGSHSVQLPNKGVPLMASPKNEVSGTPEENQAKEDPAIISLSSMSSLDLQSREFEPTNSIGVPGTAISSGFEELAKTILSELEKLSTETSEIILNVATVATKESKRLDKALMTSISRSRVRRVEKIRSNARVPPKPENGFPLVPTSSSESQNNCSNGGQSSSDQGNISVLKGVAYFDRSDLVGSANLLAQGIISALDEAAGTTVERTERDAIINAVGFGGVAAGKTERGAPPSNKTTIAPRVNCGSNLGWGLAEDVINFFTSCSVGQTKEDLSRAICEASQPGMSSLPVVEEEKQDSSDEKEDLKTSQQIVQEEDDTSKLDMMIRIRQNCSNEDSQRSVTLKTKEIVQQGSFTISPPVLSQGKREPVDRSKGCILGMS